MSNPSKEPDVIGALSDLIDSLPEHSVTRANLLAVRGAYRGGQQEEYRLHAVMKEFSLDAIQRLRQLQ